MNKSTCCEKCYREVIFPFRTGDFLCVVFECPCHQPIQEKEVSQSVMTTKLTTFEEEKLRELKKEFYLHSADFTDEHHHDIEPYQMQKIAEWWIDKLTSSLHQQREMIRKDYVTWVLAGSYASYARKYKGETPFQEWRQSAEAKDMDDWT